MREETLVNHHRHTEAMPMNILVEMEMRLQSLEIVLQNDKTVKCKRDFFLDLLGY